MTARATGTAQYRLRNLFRKSRHNLCGKTSFACEKPIIQTDSDEILLVLPPIITFAAARMYASLSCKKLAGNEYKKLVTAFILGGSHKLPVKLCFGFAQF